MKRLTIAVFGFMTSFAVAAGPTGEVGSTTPCGYVRIEGVIASIDAENMQLTVGETVVQITDGTTIKAGRNLLALSDLELAETVAAVGSFSDDVLTAVRVNVKYAGRSFADAGGTAVPPGRHAWDRQGRGMGRMPGYKARANGPNLDDRGCAHRGQGRGNRGQPRWKQRPADDRGQGWGRGARHSSGRGWHGGQGQPCRALALPPADGGTLDEAAEAALREAVLDEYAAELYYQALTETFGSSRRFDKLIRAEQRHASALLSLFDRYGIEPPTRNEAAIPDLPSTLREAIQLAIDEEEANVAMYDRLLESVTAADVEFVFTNLRSASAEHHIPSLERALR